MPISNTRKLTCDCCGKECSKLYGYIMASYNRLYDTALREILSKTEEEFGQRDFVFCWSCTAKSFGAKTLKQKAEAQEPKNHTVVCAQCHKQYVAAIDSVTHICPHCETENKEEVVAIENEGTVNFNHDISVLEKEVTNNGD